MNSKCKKCGNDFQMGYNGVKLEKVEMCDDCAGVIRLGNGDLYTTDSPYMIHRPQTSACLNAVSARPGDVVAVHPNRKVKHG